MRETSLTDIIADAISLTDAARLYHCHVASTWRHATKGVRGIRLQTWMVGGKRMTTPAAVEEFLRGLNAGADDPGDSPSDTARRSREAGRALEALGA